MWSTVVNREMHNAFLCTMHNVVDKRVDNTSEWTIQASGQPHQLFLPLQPSRLITQQDSIIVVAVLAKQYLQYPSYMFVNYGQSLCSACSAITPAGLHLIAPSPDAFRSLPADQSPFKR